MSDILNDELSAMQQVALALTQLDEPTRLRVLHWTIERFQLDVSAVARTLPQPTGSVPHASPDAADEGLSVSTLEELFTPRSHEAAASVAAATDEPARKGVSGMLSEFVAEFQDVVREWNAASETPADAGNQRASSAA